MTGFFQLEGPTLVSPLPPFFSMYVVLPLELFYPGSPSWMTLADVELGLHGDGECLRAGLEPAPCYWAAVPTSPLHFCFLLAPACSNLGWLGGLSRPGLYPGGFFPVLPLLQNS